MGFSKLQRLLLIFFLVCICGSVVLIFLFVSRSKDPQDLRSQAEFTETLTDTPVASTIARPVETPFPDSVIVSPAPTAIVSREDLFTLADAVTFTVSGTIYVDSDGDALYDLDESGYDGAQVELLGGGTRKTSADSKGAYSFSGVSVGSYTVHLSIPAGYKITTNSLTNLYLTSRRVHHIGIKLLPGATAAPTSAPGTATPSPTASPTPAPTPQQAHYYVSPTGSDSADGSEATPYLTIQKAVNVTKTDSDPGAIIHVLPGTYRESVTVNTVAGTELSPVEIIAEDGPDTVYILGSESSQDSDITWAQSDGGLSFPSGVSSHIYRADISSWNATPEMAFLDDTTITRLPKAHEPDFGITTAWKYHQNWWKAEGRVGSTENTVVDDENDVDGTYPEALTNAGNLSSINGFTSDFLSGARIFAKDTYDGHDSFTTTIASHTASSGTITLDDDFEYYDGDPAMGDYAKYFVEGKPQLLDEEGEWYYDSATEYLYIWPEGDVNPNTLPYEFAVRNTAVSIRNSQYVTFKDLNLQFTNYAYSGVTGPDGAVRFFGFTSDITHHITFDGLSVQHNGVGFRLYQSNAAIDSPGTLNHVTIKNSEILNTDSYGMMVWHFPLSGPTPFINNIRLENNEFGHMGFRGSGVGVFMQHPEKILATNNYFHHSAHNNFDIQQGKASGDSYIYIANNVFDASCYNGSDCGGMKILNSDPGGTGSNTIYIANNIMRGTKGWTWAAEAQSLLNTHFGYGYDGFGYYSDVAENTDPANGCAIILYRNIMMDNSSGGIHYTKSRDQCAFNNVIAGNGAGIQMNNYGSITDGSFGNILRGNIIQYSESGNSTNANIYGISARIDKADEDELTVDSNIYQMSGAHAYDMYKQDIAFTNVGTFTTVAQIQSNTPWEDNGQDVTGGTIGITTETVYDISTIESTFGITSVSIPSEAAATIAALNDHFGLSITNSNTVGRTP